MLVISQVSKRYGDAPALASTDLQVPGGETLVLIGPSGCGKSTLLRLITGLIQPDSGTISFEGTGLSPDNILQIRQRMGYVIQEGGLFPHLTVRDKEIKVKRNQGVRTLEMLIPLISGWGVVSCSLLQMP